MTINEKYVLHIIIIIIVIITIILVVVFLSPSTTTIILIPLTILWNIQTVSEPHL